jgi:hypothetical protein
MSRVVVNEIEAKVGNDITFNDTVKISTAQIDIVRGKTTAGSITVQGEGTATTNMQQGLAKSWLQFNQTTPAVTDSFNISTVTDTSAGDYIPNFSSAMSGLTYAVPSAGGMLNTNASGRISETNPTNTSSYQVTTTNSAGSKADYTGNSCSTFGDLA